MPFTCSICGEESVRICVRCTKDACNNHLCEKCSRCSDCCECEVTLSEPVHEPARIALRSEAGHPSEPVNPYPEPEPPAPPPDPDPFPEDEKEEGPIAP
jgi:hypothetical protein